MGSGGQQSLDERGTGSGARQTAGRERCCEQTLSEADGTGGGLNRDDDGNKAKQVRQGWCVCV